MAIDWKSVREQKAAPSQETPLRVVSGGLTMETQDPNSSDYTKFKAHIHRKTGIDLNLYKQQQMQRRLFNMVERAGVKTFEEYFKILDRDPNEMFAFLDRMTINVSELFRNPEKWLEVRDKVLPELLKEKKSLKIWSAGCSYGAEPYSLVVLLDKLSPNVRHTLHATDLDRKILAKAQEGVFSEADVKNVEPTTLKRYFDSLPKASTGIVNSAAPAYQMKPEFRNRVTFRQHNLLADKFEGDYDLICCRNVVIYFTDEAKDKLYQRFTGAMRVGGYFFVGGTERIAQSQEIGLDSPFSFFYRRKH